MGLLNFITVKISDIEKYLFAKTGFKFFKKTNYLLRNPIFEDIYLLLASEIYCTRNTYKCILKEADLVKKENIYLLENK